MRKKLTIGEKAERSGNLAGAFIAYNATGDTKNAQRIKKMLEAKYFSLKLQKHGLKLRAFDVLCDNGFTEDAKKIPEEYHPLFRADIWYMKSVLLLEEGRITEANPILRNLVDGPHARNQYLAAQAISPYDHSQALAIANAIIGKRKGVIDITSGKEGHMSHYMLIIKRIDTYKGCFPRHQRDKMVNAFFFAMKIFKILGKQSDVQGCMKIIERLNTGTPIVTQETNKMMVYGSLVMNEGKGYQTDLDDWDTNQRIVGDVLVGNYDQALAGIDSCSDFPSVRAARARAVLKEIDMYLAEFLNETVLETLIRASGGEWEGEHSELLLTEVFDGELLSFICSLADDPE